ncbi:unnamed protein product [Eruca vesicaria subsp. sativa]|uniref:RNase H type-1 domain-containing protein n=1 Tax=Eruca vesicaria subsp. sativa TaxID=29727 RepID=A0ABC8JN22_ERUVS|nr:unnamed protein product [Eruca vesicaria subsp. sativa]
MVQLQILINGRKQLNKDKEENSMRLATTRSRPTIQQVMPTNASYYCLVDASWKSSKEPMGFGWSLYCKEGNQIIQGSSSLKPANLVVEAEAIVLLAAVTQMKRLNYKDFAFMSDLKSMIDELNQHLADRTIRMVCTTDAALVLQVLETSKNESHTFHNVSREFLTHVDLLAK